MRRPILAAVAALLLALAAAQAHVTLQPNTAPAGGFTRLDVRVPNERDDARTTKVDVQLPPGFVAASYEPVPGWKVKVTRAKAAQPIDAGEGLKSDMQVSRITWTGDGKQGVIAPGQFQHFGLSLKMPEGKAGEQLTFKALQTYDDGDVVRWIGPEDADEPAPIVTLEAGSAGGGHGAPAAAAGGERDDAGTVKVDVRFPETQVPQGEAGSFLTFKAYQTYRDGERVRWSGAPESEHPAPRVKLLAPATAAQLKPSLSSADCSDCA